MSSKPHIPSSEPAPAPSCGLAAGGLRPAEVSGG